MRAMKQKERGHVVTKKSRPVAGGNSSRSTGFVAGMSTGADPDTCPECGQSLRGGGLKDRSRQLELRRALRGRKYGLDEVLRELDASV
jgi:hypothetical protein